MTRTTNARIAGFTFLFYIATGIAGMVLFNQASRGDGTAAKLASIAAHAPYMRLTFVLTMLTIFEALILAVTLYALTRDEDPDLALLTLTCRVAEGAINAIPAPSPSRTCFPLLDGHRAISAKVRFGEAPNAAREGSGASPEVCHAHESPSADQFPL